MPDADPIGRPPLLRDATGLIVGRTGSIHIDRCAVARGGEHGARTRC